jgi:hypothetical protein
MVPTPPGIQLALKPFPPVFDLSVVDNTPHCCTAFPPQLIAQPLKAHANSAAVPDVLPAHICLCAVVRTHQARNTFPACSERSLFT